MVLDVILCRKTRVVNIVHKHDVWCYTTFLPARASERASVIGSVRIYIYIYMCTKKNCN